jgi:hypothetical protein
MKILIGANNYLGSNITISRILDQLKDHEIRVAAYYRDNQYIKVIDWCLDALFLNKSGRINYFKKYHGIDGPFVSHKLVEMMINELILWAPDLIISDCEEVTATLASILEIPLWYCSPLLQTIGLQHTKSMLQYPSYKIKNYLRTLPKANRYLIYSPLCDIVNKPMLNEGFEWVKTYCKQPNKITSSGVDLSLYKKFKSKDDLITTGETSFVVDCLFSGKPFYISPNVSEWEQMLNADLCHIYGIARNVGRSNNISFVKDQINKGTYSPILNQNFELDLVQKLKES